MKTFFASDLHYGVNGQGNAAVRALATHLRSPNASRDDVLVLVGDIATDDKALRACLRLFREFPGRKLAVAGNHDVWVEGEESSWTRYRRLSAIFRAAGFHPLEDEPIVIGGTAFAGSMGWYDYSFRDEEIGMPFRAYEKKTLPGAEHPLWNDANLVRWGMSDQDVTRWQAERLERHLSALAGSDDIVLAIHHVPTKRLLFHPRCLVPRETRFANAFLGSERFAEIACLHRVALVVNGHIHMAGDARIGETRFASIGGDYRGKQLIVRDRGRLVRSMFTSEGMRPGIAFRLGA
ncbi:MAG TPA: metallophosphoesterase [Candidatus Binatia bacterium]|jgi:predicted phosphohydrolase|nr:metallophosphoesterase [Candidatus Binatia bacterium]